MSQDPIGTEAGRQRGASTVDVVSSVETVGSGDLLVTVAHAVILNSGDLGRLHERAVIRLSPGDQQRLVQSLTFAGQVAR